MNTSRSAAGAAMLGGHIYVVGKLGCIVAVYTHMHMYTHVLCLYIHVLLWLLYTNEMVGCI